MLARWYIMACILFSSCKKKETSDHSMHTNSIRKPVFFKPAWTIHRAMREGWTRSAFLRCLCSHSFRRRAVNHPRADYALGFSFEDLIGTDYFDSSVTASAKRKQPNRHERLLEYSVGIRSISCKQRIPYTPPHPTNRDTSAMPICCHRRKCL